MLSPLCTPRTLAAAWRRIGWLAEMARSIIARAHKQNGVSAMRSGAQLVMANINVNQ